MVITWFDHLIFFIIGILIPCMAFLSNKSGSSHEAEEHLKPELPPKKHIYYTNGLMLVIGALIVLTLWNVTFRSFDLLGIVFPKLTDIVMIICAVILIIYAFDTTYNFINAHKSKDALKDLMNIMPTNWKDYQHFIFLAFAAGICEEIIFRGFMINYLFEVLVDSKYSTLIALILPAIVFSISHIYQGWLAVVKIFLLSLLFGALFIYSKSLLLVILIHVLVDLVSGAVMVLAVRKIQNQEQN